MWQLALDPATTTVMSQPEILTLFCIVSSDSAPFSVEIAKNATVHQLKKIIKEEKKPELDSIPADRLILHQVDLAEDENMVENMTRIMSDPKKPSPLRSTWELVDIFKDPPKKRMVHIIVKLPGESYECLNE